MIAMLSQFRRDLGLLAYRLAPKVDERIRSVLEAERVRPPTDKSRHLKDNIRSEPVKRGARSGFGALGIGRIDLLDQTTNPEGGSDRPYWRVIEEGSERWQPDMVGRVLFGKFRGQEGTSRPSQERFRQDSSFIFGVKGSGRGVIQRPIEPQHFLQKGIEEMYPAYLAEMETLSGRYAKLLIEIEARRAARAGLVLPGL